MPKYTTEEGRTIIRGLLTGKPARPCPMMSDAEFERRYDPQGYHEQRLRELLRELIVAVNNLTEAFTPKPYSPRQNERVFDAKRPTGPVGL